MKSVVTCNPYSLMNVSALNLLDSLFEDDFYRFDARIPAVDVRETDTAYLVDIELPGMTEKDVELKVERGNLMISAGKEEKKEADKDSKDRFIRRERRSWNFSRSFGLPDNADETGIKAAFANGILSVEIPKKPETAPRKIEINAA